MQTCVLLWRQDFILIRIKQNGTCFPLDELQFTKKVIIEEKTNSICYRMPSPSLNSGKGEYLLLLSVFSSVYGLFVLDNILETKSFKKILTFKK